MRPASDAQVLVIGAGPAGLAATLAARAAGVTVTLVDEYAELGGQYHRQPAGGSARAGDLGARRIAAVRASGAEVRTGASVWGRSDEGIVELVSARGRDRIRAAAVVVATGAYERVVPFRGWTLPGVFTAGGAQTLVKWQGTLPGSRVLVCGSGPFLLPVAVQLVDAGALVVAVAEAVRFRSLVAIGARLAREPRRAIEAVRLTAAVRSRGFPILYGREVVAVGGNGRVERVHLAAANTPESILEVDAVCVGNGFVPAIEVARLFGCAIGFSAERGGWYVEHDGDQATSTAGVFVAGEPGGVAGSAAAWVSGRLAGASAAAAAGGKALPAGQRDGLRRALRREQAFVALLNRTYRTPLAAYAAVPDEVVVCRCEDVSAGEIRAVSRAWCANVNVIKGVTRTGMGPCQGRTCAPSVAGILAARTGTDLHRVGLFGSRSPLRPMPLSQLAQPPDP